MKQPDTALLRKGKFCVPIEKWLKNFLYNIYNILRFEQNRKKEIVKILKDFKNDEKFSIENAIAQNF